MPTKQELEARVAELEEQVGPHDDQRQTVPDPWAMLQERFEPKVVKHHPSSGFHYLSIDTVMNRLDDVLGPNWTLSVQTVSLAPVDPEWKQYGSRNPKTGFLASVTVRISALITAGPPAMHTVRDGVGADFADDPDKAIKTALANAVKKAANGFGVGRYLWDEEERAAIDEAQSARNDVKALKNAVHQRYLEAANETEAARYLGMPPDQRINELARAFGVEPTDMASAETLNKILEG